MYVTLGKVYGEISTWNLGDDKNVPVYGEVCTSHLTVVWLCHPEAVRYCSATYRHAPALNKPRHRNPGLDRVIRTAPI
jgi:hypothetical protein